MTDFAANETSREDGAPVELYTITQGPDVFRYTSAEDDQLVSGDSFTAAIEIQRDKIVIGPENRGQSLTITLKGNNEFAARYIGIQPSIRANVLIQRFHRFDTPPPEVVQIFEGRVSSVAFSDNGFQADVSVTPLIGATSRTIPLFTFQSPCNNNLYDVRCKVLRTAFQFTGTVSAISSDGLTLTVDGLDAAKGVGFATGGEVRIPSTSDPRMILNHTATDQIKLNLPFRTDVLNTQVDVFAGCDHSIAVCKSKFDNVVNFGGHAFVPTRNIFNTGLD